MKASIDAKDIALDSLPTDELVDKGNDDDTDLAKMSEKDRKKEDARIAREKEKEKKKKKREDERSKEKAECADVKVGKKLEGSSKKSKDAVVTLSTSTISVSDDTPEINPVTLSSGTLKRNAAFARLSISRMQLNITRKLKDCIRDALNVDEFFFKDSFLSAEDHHVKYNKYSRECLELIAFIEKVRGSPFILTLKSNFDSSNQILVLISIFY